MHKRILRKQSSKLVTGTLVFSTLLIAAVGSGLAQDKSPVEKDAVVVRSWKSGNSRISEQTLSVLLDDPHNEFVFDVKSAANILKYRMRFRPVRLSTFGRDRMQCWATELNELSSSEGLNGHLLGWNLLSDEGAGEGDNLPSTANFFCPIETQQKWRDGGYLGISRLRIFEIEGFTVKIFVPTYSYDEKTKTMNSIQFEIFIRNAPTKSGRMD